MVKGIVRNLDQLGRATLPKEYRKTLGMEDGEPVDIYLDGDVICIKKAKLQCVSCGDTDEKNLIIINGVHMCPKCIRAFYLAAQGGHKHE